MRAAEVTDGKVGTKTRLTPPGDDFVLADLAVSAQGAVLVLSLSGTRGNDASGAQRVFGTYRAAGAPAFGPAELVSDAAPDAPPVAVRRGGHRRGRAPARRLGAARERRVRRGPRGRALSCHARSTSRSCSASPTRSCWPCSTRIR